MGTTETSIKTNCFHCGDLAGRDPIIFDSKSFCCVGCKSVYEILSTNNLCDYYSIEENPGLTLRNPVSKIKFNYLDDLEIQRQLIDYQDEKIAKITFHISAMHCSSCIWLLESLYKINRGVKFSRVDFLRKQLAVTFDPKLCSLKQLVELLASLGYEPNLNMNDLEQTKAETGNRRLLYQVGVAGFCFGNIMLISFPEYFGLDQFSNQTFSKLFGFLNMGLAMPVFFYSAQDYFKSAYKSLSKGIINIDFPLALGILVMFLRSIYEVVSHTGIGFFDTLAGLVFFLLIGKWVQQRTIDTLSFERDYKSYFPVAVSVLQNKIETTVPVTNLKIGDRILIRNNEIIPADAILLNGEAKIDFSFVTGESQPVEKVLGEIIYAGGRQVGSTLELEISKTVSQSYLTQLWNSEHFTKGNESRMTSFQTTISKYFTWALLAIAITSGLYWLVRDPSLSLGAFSSVLIIACPCALALSSPFALGNSLRMMGRSKFYLKAPNVVEKMANVNHIVFDKTGTITQPSEASITYEGKDLSDIEKQLIFSICAQSVHPLSQKIVNYFLNLGFKKLPVSKYKEIGGKGLEGWIAEQQIKVGSASYLNISITEPNNLLVTKVYILINDLLVGSFSLNHSYRAGLNTVIHELSKQHTLGLLSGDQDAEKAKLSEYFPQGSEMHFKQSPADKMLYIEKLHQQGNSVAMVGDGLNDAGALKLADVGISVTENTAHFSPSSDVIMDASVFNQLGSFFKYAKDTMRVIHFSFIISLIYNLVGLSFAVRGVLSPIIAAVLMPISSISVIVFTTLATYLYAKKNKLF